MKRLMFVVLIIMCLLPNAVWALTFKDGDKTYHFSEIEISCDLSDVSYATLSKDNNFIYENSENGDKQIKILDNGTCRILEGQELLDYYNGFVYPYYSIRKESGNTAIISYKYEGVKRENILIPTEDTEINPLKGYYEIEVGVDSFYSAPATSGNINNYYELADLMLNKNIKQDSNKTYYELNDFDYATKVDDYLEEKAIEYFVLINESVKTTITEVKKLPDSFEGLLNSASYFVIHSPIDDSFYIPVSQQNDAKWDVYGTNGDVIFEDIDSIVIVNSLFLVTTDNITKFYNFNKELVYELENTSVLVSKVSGDTSTVIGKKDNKDTIFVLKLEEISNPDTIDNINVMIILLIISIIGISISIYSLNKKDCR